MTGEINTMKTEMTFLLDGLACPNCAAKIEDAVRKIEGVGSATVNLMSRELNASFDTDPSEFEKAVRQIVQMYEPNVRVSISRHEEESANEDENDENEKKERKLIITRLIAGSVLFVTGIILKLTLDSVIPSLVLFIISYLILGYDVIIKAVRNVIKGKVFEEHFLMTVSTVCAFVIGEYPEGVAVMLFYQIGEFFQDLAVVKSRRSISSLLKIRPDTAVVLKDGIESEISAENVRIGDIVVIRPGERIPVDGIIIDGSADIDTSPVTGESVPRCHHAGDEVVSGCICANGMIYIKAEKTYGESTASKIIEMVESASSKKAKSEQFITRFSRYYTPVVVIAAVLIAVIPSIITGNWQEWVRRGCIFLIISCPCALVLSVPLAFFGGIGAASRAGVLVKGGNYLEQLGKADCFVFDKTGTLTNGSFTVSEIRNEDWIGREELIKLAASAENRSSHPIARAICAYHPDEIYDVCEFRENAGNGITAKIIKGDGEKTDIAVGKNLFAEPDKDVKNDTAGKMTTVYVSVDGRYAGSIGVSDILKDTSREAVRKLKDMGIKKTVMLTGDNAKTAEAVAKETGVDECYSNLLPGEKVGKLEQIIEDGYVTAFAGDGINDGPALARADVGIAMGAMGSDAALEAADIVVMDDDILKMTSAVNVSRKTMRIVKENIVFALAVKILFLALGALGVCDMWMAVFADVGVSLIAVANSMRLLRNSIQH